MEADNASHFASGGFLQSNPVGFCVSPGNMKLVPLNRHKAAQVSSYRGIDTTNRKLSPRSIDSEGDQSVIMVKESFFVGEHDYALGCFTIVCHILAKSWEYLRGRSPNK